MWRNVMTGLTVVVSIGAFALLVGILGCEDGRNGGKAARRSIVDDIRDIRAVSNLGTSALPFRPDRFEDAIKAYASASSKVKRGVFQLPGKLAGLTVEGRLYVTKGLPSGDIYLFVTWRGKGSNLQGYVRCIAPRGGAVPMEAGSVEIVGPGHTATSGKIEVEVESTNTGGWYRVYRDLD